MFFLITRRYHIDKSTICLMTLEEKQSRQKQIGILLWKNISGIISGFSRDYRLSVYRHPD